MRDDDHDRLVDRTTQGDAAALEALLERHLPSLLVYVRLHAGELLRRKEASQDLVQSVCREILASMDRFEHRGAPAFRAWLFAKALGKIRDRQRYWLAGRRDARRERELTDSVSGAIDHAAVRPQFASPSQAAIGEEEMRRLEDAFEELPEDYRQVITLARIVGLPHAEIAAQMERSEAATRVLLYRALARLGRLMDGERGPSSRGPGSND